MSLTCHTCGEHLDGDGYNSVLRCPNAEEQGADLDIAPDSNPVYCKPQPHWADDHIIENFDMGEFDAYDEAGLLYGTFDTREQARQALDAYAKTL